MPSFLTRLILALCLVLCLPLLSADVYGFQKSKSKSLDFGLGNGLGDGFNDSLLGTPYEYEASYESEEGGLRGRVNVQVKLNAGYHTFSTTQPPGGPAPTVITITSPGVTLAGPFSPDTSFDISLKEEGFEGVRVESGYFTVRASARRFAEGVKAARQRDVRLITVEEV